MSTTVPREFEEFVAHGIASGRFRSEEDAAAEAFDLLRRREQKLDALRAEYKSASMTSKPVEFFLWISKI